MIRSLTIGLPIGHMSIGDIEAKTLEFISQFKRVCETQGIEVRTIRFTLPPASTMSEDLEGADLVSLLAWVDQLATKAGVRWFCLPLDFSDEYERKSRLAISLRSINNYPKLFLNIIVSNGSSISLGGVADASKQILEIAKGGKGGFNNFRVGVSSGVPANSPFFPYSRHEGSYLKFSFALESVSAASNALEAESKKGTFSILRTRAVLVETLSAIFKEIDSIGKILEERTSIIYSGLDASFAPLPQTEHSVINLLRYLRPPGDTSWGGFIAVTALATDIIRQSITDSGARTTGFNGVMFSVLEDSMLAEAISRREVDISYLTALSAVCGCGIDMVPIPGDTFPEEIAAVVLDICAMSVSLGKPLGIRLLPIPNSQAGDYTRFNMDFLCDSRLLTMPKSAGILNSQKEELKLFFPLRTGWQDSSD